MEAAIVMSKRNINLLIALALIALAVSLRVLPHPANFAPIAAIAIFGGAILPRRAAIWLPLGAMIISDLIIGWHNLIPITWGCYVLIALTSSYWMKKPSFGRGLALVMSSSVFFFVLTNFGVWVWSGMYAHSLSGLAQCYSLALPFFRNTALSDLVYTGALFGIYALATQVTARFVQSPNTPSA